jgi:NAD(P)-dependent dehydrogenase (short-subunit alcohol dehydrogenase family)
MTVEQPKGRRSEVVDYRRLFDLTGRRALVIGAAGGIGRAVSQGLGAFGAEVVCADVDEEGAAETARQIALSGGTCSTAVVDIRDGDSIATLAATFGVPDVLVVTPAINVRKRLIDVSDAEFDRVIDLNIKGTFRVIRAFAPGMADRGSGSIIAFSSIRAQVVEPGQGVYAATKAATLQMLRVLAAELGPRNVRVNVVAPGVVETPLTEQIKSNESWYRAYAEKSILGRWAQPAEMVGAVLLLASDAGSYITGSYLLVDGGWTAWDGRFSPPL